MCLTHRENKMKSKPIKKLSKTKKVVVVGDKRLNPLWKKQLEEVRNQRTVASWLFEVQNLVHTSKYRICKSLKGDVVVWRNVKPPSKLKIPITNTLPYFNNDVTFIREYYEEICNDKRHNPRVVSLKNIDGKAFSSLLLQCLEREEGNVITTWVEIRIVDVDEFYIAWAK